jgi:hypothetical protein
MPHLTEFLTPQALETIENMGLTMESLFNVSVSFSEILECYESQNILSMQPPNGRKFAVPQIWMKYTEFNELCKQNCIDLDENIFSSNRNQMKKNRTKIEIETAEGDAMFLNMIKKTIKCYNFKKSTSHNTEIAHESEFHVSQFEIDYIHFIIDSDNNIWMHCIEEFPRTRYDPAEIWINLFDPRWRSGRKAYSFIEYEKSVTIITTEIPSTNHIITQHEMYKNWDNNPDPYCMVDLTDIFESNVFRFCDFLEKIFLNGTTIESLLNSMDNHMRFFHQDFNYHYPYLVNLQIIPYGLLMLCNTNSNVIHDYIENESNDQRKQSISMGIDRINKFKKYIENKSKFHHFLIGTLRRKNNSNKSIVKTLPIDILNMILKKTIYD